MQFKSLPVLAVTLAGLAMTLVACQAPSSSTQQGSTSSAQPNTEMPDTPARSGSGSNRYMQGASLSPELQLTDEQKTKIKGIQENYRSQMENIFTDQQKNELKAAREQGKKPRQVMESLNLTEAQKQQIKELRQSQRQEIDNVLTAEQKQQLQKMRQSRQPMPEREGNGVPPS